MEYLTIRDNIKTFYSEKDGAWKALSTVKISLDDPNRDLREAIAERIYDIRCRIVHTKSDGGQTRSEVLLPFSKEADDLVVDVDLIQYIARQVLIATSTKLSL